MRLIGRIAAVFFAFVAIPLLTFAACNLSINNTLLEDETYRNAIISDRTFDELLPLVIPALIESGNMSVENTPVDLDEMVNTVRPDVWRDVAREIIPPDWIRQQYEHYVEVILRILEGDFTALEEDIDLTGLRNGLQGEQAQQAADIILAAAPPCNISQNDRIRSITAGGDALLPICQPAMPLLRNTSLNTLVNWFHLMGEQLPAEPQSAGEVFDFSRDEARILNLVIEIDQQILSLTFLCPMALLALIIVVGVRSWRGFGAWMGSIVVFAGLSTFMLMVMLQVAIFESLFTGFDTANEAERIGAEFAAGFVRSAFNQSSQSLFVMGGFFILLGFALFVIAFLAPKPSESTPRGRYIITDEGAVFDTTSNQLIGTTTIQIKNNQTTEN